MFSALSGESKIDKQSKILQETFGFSSFRPLQAEAIQSVLQKQNSLVIMPTGGGKSLCYQIPAMMFEGLTLVVSPLISLMEDQVHQLRELGVSALFLNSTLSWPEYEDATHQILSGKVDLLYVAPETLMLDKTQELLRRVKVDCITVDEAHCISEWGHDFRPEYRQIQQVASKMENIALIALTATATPRVQEDIVRNLGMERPRKFLASFNRKNLFLEVNPKMNALQQTLSFLEKNRGQSGIIYCFTRKQVDTLSQELEEARFSVKGYHAGMSDTERRENQRAFIRDDVQIIVATIAFGMGINKPNVRFIVHHDLPKNIESYYQQIGRAGRDGLPAHCLLLFGYGDIRKIQFFMEEMEAEEQRIAQIHLNALLAFAESDACRRIPLLEYFGETPDFESCGHCDNCQQDLKEIEDLTVAAQKFFSCVRRSGELFGAGHIVDILRESKSKKVLAKSHDQLSTYGIGMEFTRRQWMYLSRQLIRQKFLIQDQQFGGLSLTNKAWEVLRGQAKFLSKVPEDALESSTFQLKPGDYDSELFTILRKLRKSLADKRNVPPYAIFSDRSLTEFAHFYPQSEESFLAMHGVGQQKLTNFGGVFLEVIRNYCQTANIEERPIPKKSSDGLRQRSATPRAKLMKEKYNNGMHPQQIADEVGIKLNTVLNHLLTCFQDGQSLRKSSEFEEICNIPHQQIAQVKTVFRELGTERLKPVYDRFSGHIQYDDLRILQVQTLVDQCVEG